MQEDLDPKTKALIKALRDKGQTRWDGADLKHSLPPDYQVIPPATQQPKLITPEDETEILNPSDRKKRLQTRWV